MSYALFESGAPYAEWEAACAALNKVQFTAEDVEEGFELIRYAEVDHAALSRYTGRFQDAAPEMVVAALHARFNLVAEAQDCGVDLKVTNPNIYGKMLTGPLIPEDFDIYAAFVDAEH